MIWIYEPQKVATSLNNYFRDKVIKIKERIKENIDLALEMCDNHMREQYGDKEKEKPRLIEEYITYLKNNEKNEKTLVRKQIFGKKRSQS